MNDVSFVYNQWMNDVSVVHNEWMNNYLFTMTFNDFTATFTFYSLIWVQKELHEKQVLLFWVWLKCVIINYFVTNRYLRFACFHLITDSPIKINENNLV